MTDLVALDAGMGEAAPAIVPVIVPENLCLLSTQ